MWSMMMPLKYGLANAPIFPTRMRPLPRFSSFDFGTGNCALTFVRQAAKFIEWLAESEEDEEDATEEESTEESSAEESDG